MKRTWVKVICIVLALTLCGAGLAFAAKKAGGSLDVGKALLDSWEMINHHQYKKAADLLNKVLAQDPGNPLALNNLAAVMVAEKKFDKADTYLNQALPRAKGYMVEVNKVCTVGNICSAFRPVAGAAGNQDLEPLIKVNIDMVKDYMKSGHMPGSGLRPK